MGTGVELSSNPLTRKLGRFVPLSDADTHALDSLGDARESFDLRQDIVAAGAVPRAVFVLQEGMACRYRILRDGRRQITSFLIPGDLCDLHAFLLKEMDHSIGTITPVSITNVAWEAMIDLTFHHPRIATALWWSALQEEAILRERIVALGRRDARGRVGYLLSELVWRHRAVGLAEDDSISLLLTQSDIADALGLTPVYVNRILQEFRRAGLLQLERRKLLLRNRERLQEIAELNDNYLHLGGAPSVVHECFERQEALLRVQRSPRCEAGA